MADLHTLAKMLQELDDQMATCMKCGLCQSVCPVFAETMREGDVTRGKIALLEDLAHEMLADAQGVQDKLNKCLLCGSCAANCPSGVKIMDIFLRARVIVNTYMGLSPAKKAILRGMLTRPKLFNGLMDLASKFQGLFTKPVSDIIGSSCTRFTTPLGDRHFMPLAKESLHSLIKPMDTPAGKSGLKVAFYPGCLVDKIFPRIGIAVLKVLEHHGVGVYLPEGWACCGIPAISSGEKTAYDAMVMKNLDVFAGRQFDYMVTACASCTSTVHEIWPMFAGGLFRRRAGEAQGDHGQDPGHQRLPGGRAQGGPLGGHSRGQRTQGDLPRPLPPQEVPWRFGPAARSHQGRAQHPVGGNGGCRPLLRMRRQFQSVSL